MKTSMKILIIIAAIVVAVAIAAVVILSLPRFGRMPSGERQARIEQSPFYQDGVLQNEVPTVTMTNGDGYLKAIWNFLLGTDKSDRLIPKAGEVPLIKTDVKALQPDRDRYIWFGHSSFLLQLSGKNLLVDPVFVSAAPFSFVNKPFPGTDYYQPDMMPDTIDYLIISHDHWDHLDYATVRQLRHRVGKVVCSLLKNNCMAHTRKPL